MAINVVELRGTLANVSRKWIVAIVAEGFLEAELASGQPSFEDAANTVATEIATSSPFSAFADSIVIVGVEVASHSSATLLGDDPPDRCKPTSSLWGSRPV